MSHRTSSCLGFSVAAALLLTASCSDGPEVTSSTGGPGMPGMPGMTPGSAPGMVNPGPTITIPDAGASSPPSNGPAPGEKNCGLRKFGLQRQPAEMLLVLDRSGSMMFAGPDGKTRWEAMTSALDDVIKRTQASVHWGLKLYPATSACGVGQGVEVAPAVNNHAPIMAAIAGNPARRNGGATPTHLGVQNAAAFMQRRMTMLPKYLLLATDGLPNCVTSQTDSNPRDQQAAIKSVEDAFTAGLRTFVLGVAIEPAAQQTLSAIAAKGGQARATTPSFYPASSRDEIVATFDNIAGLVASCSFQLGEAPPSPNDVAVDADGMRVPRDPAGMDGWNYAGPGMRSVVLHGSWCQKLQTGAVKDVQITFGCPGVLIP